MPQPGGSLPPLVADPHWLRTKQMSVDPAASIGHTAQGQLQNEKMNDELIYIYILYASILAND